MDFTSLWFVLCQPWRAWMKLTVTQTEDEEQYRVALLMAYMFASALYNLLLEINI